MKAKFLMCAVLVVTLAVVTACDENGNPDPICAESPVDCAEYCLTNPEYCLSSLKEDPQVRRSMDSIRAVAKLKAWDQTNE